MDYSVWEINCKYGDRFHTSRHSSTCTSGWYYDLFDTLLRNCRVAGDFGDIACDFGKIHNALLCEYFNVNTAGIVMRCMTIESMTLDRDFTLI
jgi:hypothetical protein